MLEVIVTLQDFRVGLMNAKSELEDYLNSVTKSITKDSTSNEVNKIIADSLEVLVASYYALTDTLTKSFYLGNEQKRNAIIWNFSLSCSSTAILNFLERQIGREIEFDQSTYGLLSPINPDELRKGSRYAIISQTLSGLRSHINSTGRGGNPIYKLALYFSNLEAMAGYEAKMACSEEGFQNELVQLKPVSESDKISFRIKSRKSNRSFGKNGSPQEVPEGDKLPDHLPEYIPSNVTLNRVIGSDYEKRLLVDYILKTLHYDPKSKRNFFWMDGHGFPEGVLLYGAAGVGKTMLANAVMNYALNLSKEHNIVVAPVSIDGHHINSIYKDRSAALLEHYFSMLRKGDVTYIVLIDEFDDLIPMGHDGRISDHVRQRLSAFKRSTGNSGALGNYFIIAVANRVSDEVDIPPEIKDRFTPLFIPGPQTAEEYGMILRQGLEIKEKYGLVDSRIDWTQIGSYLLRKKAELDSYNNRKITIGRSYKWITQELATTTLKPLTSYTKLTLGKTADFHEKFYSREFSKINSRDIYDAIDAGIAKLINSQTFVINGVSKGDLTAQL